VDILLWIILGGIVGWVASVIMRTGPRSNMVMDVLLGIIGAVVGGFIMTLLGQPGVTGFNLYSIIVAILGAIAVIWIGRIVYR